MADLEHTQTSGSPSSLGSGIQEITSKLKPTCHKTVTVCKTGFVAGKLPDRRQSLGACQKRPSTTPVPSDNSTTTTPSGCIVNASDIPYCGEDPEITSIRLANDIQSMNKVKF